MKIIEAGDRDMRRVHLLFREYQQWLGIDLCFQGFEEELASLPGAYAPPAGAVFLASEKSELIGCAAIRPRTGNEAELKRLYVRPEYQGRGTGKTLFHTAMSRAKTIGYETIVLDTLPAMKTAKSLYLAYGFEEIPAYYNNPEDGVEYYRYVFRKSRQNKS